MFNKKGIAVLTSALLMAFLMAFALYLFPEAWSQEKPRDAGALLDAMTIEKGDWVADVGSGEGEYTLQMAAAVGDSGRAFAVDIDEDDLEELNDAIKDRGVAHITTVSSVYDNPMLPRRSFDAVLIRNAYHEFTLHEAMLRHIRAALKPGGRLVLAEYIEDEMVERNREAQVEEHNLAMRYAREELTQAGFEIVNEMDTLRYSDAYGRRIWMMVAVRPGGDE